MVEYEINTHYISVGLLVKSMGEHSSDHGIYDEREEESHKTLPEEVKVCLFYVTGSFAIHGSSLPTSFQFNIIPPEIQLKVYI